MEVFRQNSGRYVIAPILAAAAICLNLPGSGYGMGASASGAGPVHIVLDKTWEPKSGQIIDCRGGWILPRKLAAANRGVSEPDTLLHLGAGVENVQILNCRLDATFPIVITGGKGHRISGNTIRSTSRSIYVVGGEQTMIDHNNMRSMGRNVEIRGDSKETVLYRNHLSYQLGGHPVEGWPGITNDDEPGAVGVYVFSVPGVIYLVINDRLIQVLSYGDTRITGTVVRENTIDLRSGSIAGFGIIFATRSEDSLAEDNTIFGGGIGLGVFGLDDGGFFYEPGVYSEDPEFYCNFGDGVCEFIGAGECIPGTKVTGGGRVLAPTFKGNRVFGAFHGFDAGLSKDLVFENNHLEKNDVGIFLVGYALESSTKVQGNIVLQNKVGLRLEDDSLFDVEEPGLEVSYNDFGDNKQSFDAYRLMYDDNGEEVIDVLPYLKSTTLNNNWWASAPCGFPQNQERWPNVEDLFAAALPIAAAWQAGEADAVPRCD